MQRALPNPATGSAPQNPAESRQDHP